MMPHLRSLAAGYLFSVCLFPFAQAQGTPVEWEIHQAFPSWVEGERWMVFAKITNVSDDVIPLAGQSVRPMVEQTRLVPEWKDGMQPHSHGHQHHSHHLLGGDEPWKSTLEWRQEPLHEFQTELSRALMPEESEVIGELDFRFLLDYQMPDPHMDGFRLGLRLGPDRYALSDLQRLVFADVPKLDFANDLKNVKTHPILEEVESSWGSFVPIREIEIDGESWLFQSTFRIARVPKGATPQFRTEDGKQTLIIEFDGVEEEPVRVNIAQAFPLSGSELTVPHLHLWRRLTDRSMFDLPGTKGGFFKETGLTLEQALTLKWDGTDPELKVGGIPASNPKEASDGRNGGDTFPPPPGEEASEGSEAMRHDRNFWIWAIVGLVVVGVSAFGFTVRKNGTKD